ncbi:MAG: enoyl-CoA hydratase/isomerase family protein, partial [Legionella sp.]|nr:enoyl-CoA hydratase/isomerase family protein [Legionella sp.]
LIESGNLGQKTGQGVYRKRGKALEVYDIALSDYRPINTLIPDEIKAIFKLKTPSEQFAALSASDIPEADLIRSCFRDLFHYAAFHLETIADSADAVDSALKWGFGWQQGPFETWQAFGLDAVREWIEQDISSDLSMASVTLPAWKFANKSSDLPVYQRQLMPPKKTNQTAVLFENEGVCLSHLKDDVAILSFKTKSNTISQLVLDGLNQAIELAEQKTQGIIIYQDNPINFCSGADLSAVAGFLETHQIAALASMVHDFQRTLMRLKYSAVPVVSALRGRALGGGCELLMQSDAVVAAFESYPGLVEAGVGLIPAGGGSKELALRAANLTVGQDMMPRLYPYFEQAAMGMVASSAPDAIKRGFMREKDVCVMHADEVLFAALHQIKAMHAAYYTPPIPARFKVAGREGAAQLKAALVNFEEGRFISQHDAFLASQLADVMCGGDVDSGTEVDEAWILRLEHAAFMRLAETPETQARIRHMLETGKPLRN